MKKRKKSTAPKLPFSVEKGASPNVVVVRHGQIKSGWEQWYLLRSDGHTDNPDSNISLQLDHLEEAKARNAGILDFGDLFCAMQGKFDKRSDKSKVRPEHQFGDYLDSLVQWMADLYEPYAQNWIMQGTGNHEASILHRHETSLIDRFCQTMRNRTGAAVLTTGYTGWVAFKFRIFRTQNQSIRLWHTHGYGGGGPVTKDMIQRSRQLAYIDNADIICSGHTHDQWVTKDVRIRLNTADFVEQRPCVVVKCPTYKDEYKSGVGGWHIATGKPPKPLGAYWLRFYLSHEKKEHAKSSNAVIKFEVREAES